MERTGPDLLSAVRRFLPQVLALSLVCALLAVAVAMLSSSQQAFAEGSVALKAPSQINVIAPGAQGDASLARYASQRALFMQSDTVLEAAAEQLVGISPAELRRTTTVKPSLTTTSMVVRAQAPTIQGAQDVVNALIGAYRTETARQVADRNTVALDSIAKTSARLQASLAADPSQATSQATAIALADLTQRSAAQQADSAVYGDGVDFVQAPGPGSSGTPGIPLRQTALGGLLGLVLGCTAAWLRADRHPLLGGPVEVEAVLGAARLATLPPRRSWTAGADVQRGLLECGREVLAPLLRAGMPALVLVTGTGPGTRAGCTATATGLTAALATEGLKPLLIDGDARGATAALGLDRDPSGLVDVLLKESEDPRDFSHEVELIGAGPVFFLPAGRPSAQGQSFSTSTVKRGFERLRAAFEVVVLDTPLATGDLLPSVVIGVVDVVVLVVRKGTPLAELVELTATLRANEARIAGFVFDEGRPVRRRRGKAPVNALATPRSALR